MAVLRTYYDKGYTLEELHQIIKQGKAREFLHIGDQIYLSFDGKSTAFDIIGFDAEKPVDPDVQHTVTLQMHGLIEPRAFGSNNKWEESEIRAYLNSDDFRERLAEFAPLPFPENPYLCEVYKDNDDRGETKDTFFLLSREEYGDDGESKYEYYSNTGELPRVKAANNETWWHWTRSAYRGSANNTWYVHSSGYVNYYYSYTANRCAPACVIC